MQLVQFSLPGPSQVAQEGKHSMQVPFVALYSLEAQVYTIDIRRDGNIRKLIV